MTPSPMYPYGSNLDLLWETDPRMLGVRIARYKFVAKMFAGLNLLEVGAGDGRLGRVVAQEAASLTLTDANPQADMLQWSPVNGPFYGGRQYDGIYALDVIEHVPEVEESAFMAGIVASLRPAGAIIIGCPSLESQPYASIKSRESHVNCKTEAGLRRTLEPHFSRIFMFGMNDEVVHTGFAQMCHYRFALCTNPRAI
jgi:hypothetical protein